MTITAENQNEQLEPGGFEITGTPGSPITLTYDDAAFEVTPGSDVTVDDTGGGVQVKRVDAPAPGKPNPSILFNDNDLKKVSTYNATVRPAESKDVPADVATNGKVFLVNRNDAGNTAAAEGTKPETGLRLNLEGGYVTGEIDGTDFGIKGSTIVVDANRIQVTPAAEASTDEKTDIHYGLSARFAAVQGAHVNVRIEVDGDVSTVYTKVKGGLTLSSAESANTGANGTTLEVNGNVTRLTLAAKVFDINTATGKVKAYTASHNDEVGNGGDPELAGLEPVKADYKIVTSEDGKRVALDGPSLEKTADGTLVTATDGPSQLYSAKSAPKQKQKQQPAPGM